MKMRKLDSVCSVTYAGGGEMEELGVGWKRIGGSGGRGKGGQDKLDSV